MIEVTQLSKSYGQVHALKEVSFTVETGQIVGFLGANGAGKTTTMDIMCGCIGADSGVVKIAGFDITENPLEAKKSLGYLPDSPPLHGEMRVEEFVRYAGELHQIPKKFVKQKVDYALEKLSLTDVRSRLVGNLSKGYRQRVALAQAIVHDPKVLILDEPTEGLDPNQIAHIRELIRSLAGQHTILLSSHILSEVQNTCDRIVIIHNGSVVQQGTYQELVQAMEAGSIFKLKVAREAESLIPDLRNLSGIINPHITSDTATIEFGISSQASADLVEEVVKTVMNKGCGFRELAEKPKSLEEVFFKLTH
jgi:ABC-2 type transport system ATP-binding protein